jgi:hypothetical protein
MASIRVCFSEVSPSHEHKSQLIECGESGLLPGTQCLILANTV